METLFHINLERLDTIAKYPNSASIGKSNMGFYRTHVHMGSDHWVAMSLQELCDLVKALVKDPS